MVNGEINQISIPVSNFELTKKFFEAVFGWDVDINRYSPNYAIVKWDSELSLGFYPSKNIVEGGPMLVFSVESIGRTIASIEANGGEILQAKHDMSDGEYGAVFRDPFGNRFRIKGPI